MSGGRDDDWCVDGVGVHARLVIVVHSYKRPVRHHARDADCASGGILAGDEIFDCSGVEEFNVRERKHLG